MMVALLFLTTMLAVATPGVPDWGHLPVETKDGIKGEGIHEEEYGKLTQREILTEKRPVPAGKTGVHAAAFGIVRCPVEKLWDALENCKRSPEFMPHIKSCKEVRPDQPLPANERWDEVQLSFNVLCFNKTCKIINQTTLDEPHHIGWRLVKGDAKVNEGYYRIITIGPEVQLLIYDELSDPGVSVPSFVQTSLITNSLPDVIAALRNRVEGQSTNRAAIGEETIKY